MIGPTKTPQPSGIGSIPSISDAPPQSDSPGVGCKDTFPFLALVFAVASGGGGVEEVAGFFFGLRAASVGGVAGNQGWCEHQCVATSKHVNSKYPARYVPHTIYMLFNLFNNVYWLALRPK